MEKRLYGEKLLREELYKTKLYREELQRIGTILYKGRTIRKEII